MIEPGTVLDEKYEILRLIGQGGMGAVYEARHLAVDRKVAVKFLLGTLAANADVRKRFEREARAAGKIDHDNVCEVFDFGEAPSGSLYYVMPVLRGESLEEALRETGPMPIDRVCDIGAQTLLALSAAHAAGLVHRDLKPDNVFLTTVGDRKDFVKVLDFGISKALEDPDAKEPAKAITATGAVLGTPLYMAPEQARGDKAIDHRVDLYALGVILYRMLTAKLPIDGESYNEILWNIWNQPITPPRAHRSDIPPAVEEVVQKALRRNRHERFPSADAMRHALVAAAGAEEEVSVHDEATVPPPARRVDEIPTTVEGPPASPTLTPSPVTVTSPGLSRRRTALVLGSIAVVGVGAVAIALASFRGAGEAPLTAAPAVDVAATTAAAAGDAGAAEADGGAPPAPSEPAASASSDAGDSAAREADGGGPAAEQPAESVTVTLVSAPEGARVTVDGRPIEGLSFEVAPGRRVRVEARADGFQPWRRWVSASEPTEVEVEMRAARASAPAGKRPGRPAGTKRPPTSGVDGALTDFGAVP